MHASLHPFLSRLTGAIVHAQAPVVFIAVDPMPLSLNVHT